jgi:hypothetical protein
MGVVLCASFECSIFVSRWFQTARESEPQVGICRPRSTTARWPRALSCPPDIGAQLTAPGQPRLRFFGPQHKSSRIEDANT